MGVAYGIDALTDRLQRAVSPDSEGDGVLIVLDGRQVRQPSVDSAIGLAKRLDCMLFVLLLAPSGPGAEDSGEHGCLEEVCLVARAADVAVSAALRRGDRASELLKFLGSRTPFRALIWGGDPQVLSARPFGGGRHWFNRIRAQIHCPVVTASGRDPNAGHGSAPRS